MNPLFLRSPFNTCIPIHPFPSSPTHVSFLVIVLFLVIVFLYMFIFVKCNLQSDGDTPEKNRLQVRIGNGLRQERIVLHYVSTEYRSLKFCWATKDSQFMHSSWVCVDCNCYKSDRNMRRKNTNNREDLCRDEIKISNQVNNWTYCKPRCIRTSDNLLSSAVQ